MAVSHFCLSANEAYIRDVLIVAGSTHGRFVQADTDTPYPRNKAGGMSASWTRYDGEEALELDGRYSVGHRMREGRV